MGVVEPKRRLLSVFVNKEGRGESMERTEKTYWLLCPSLKRVKIGTSYRPLKRMASLRTMNAARVEPLLVHRVAEIELHQRFAIYRDHGEWFHVHHLMVSYLRSIDENIAADRLEQVINDE